MKRSLWLFLMLWLCIPCLSAYSRDTERGGLIFSFANPQTESIATDEYFCFDVMVASTGAEDRLGTGIVLLNYNPQVFGSLVCSHQNAVVTKGSLLITALFPLYGLMIADNNANRIAVTFEYISSAGWGNIIDNTPQQLMNIKLKILSYAGDTELSFAESLMSNQQYMDDNSTLFNPVIALDYLNYSFSVVPENLLISITNSYLLLNWQEVSGCTYNVYSAETPTADDWQLEVSGLNDTFWSCLIAAPHRFYMVTADFIRNFH